jgi:hypothetical protein
MSLKKGNIKGSSIIEVVTGIFIISLSLALTGVLFAGVLNSSSRIEKQRAWFHLNQWSNQIKMSGYIIFEEMDFPLFRMVKETEVMDKERDLVLVRIIAVDNNGETIATRKFLVKAQDNNGKEK